jgi:hypothetical protein
MCLRRDFHPAVPREPEVSCFLGWKWDITKAKKLAEARGETVQLSAANVKQYAHVPKPKKGYTVLSLTGFSNLNEEHMLHIPNPNEPVIFAPMQDAPCPGSRDGHSWWLIDGHYRMALAAREGRGIAAYVLTDEEDQKCRSNLKHS